MYSIISAFTMTPNFQYKLESLARAYKKMQIVMFQSIVLQKEKHTPNV